MGDDNKPIVEKVGDDLKMNLVNTDAVLLLTEDMEIKMVIKAIGEGEPVPENAALLTAIGTRLRVDPNFVPEMMRFLENYDNVDPSGITSKFGDISVKTDIPDIKPENTAKSYADKNGIVWN